MCYFPRHSFSTSVSLLAEGHVTFCLKRWFSEPAERAHIVFPKARNVSVLTETCGMVLVRPGQQSLSWSYRNHLLSLGRSLSLLHIQSLIEGSATSPRAVNPVEDFMSPPLSRKKFESLTHPESDRRLCNIPTSCEPCRGFHVTSSL